MYRDLGFLRVWGGQGVPADAARDLRGVPYAYLIYPHKPIVAYLPQTGQLLNEYCVEFPDETRPYGSARLPDSDDVLAKWMALKGDERRLIAEANLHLPGRQFDPKQVQRDIWRLGRWERERLEHPAAGPARRRHRPPGTTPPPHRPRPTDGRPGSQAQLPCAHRGTRTRGRPRPAEGHRLRRRGDVEADHRRRHDVDRDDALQLPPPRARGEGEGGRPRRRRHADGVQHDRDLRRHHDGHGRHEDVAGQPRGDRRLDRARRARAPVRRRDRDLRLRQDDPRHRDGARAARPPRSDALRRLDRARALQRRRRDDPGGLRGGRRPRRREDHRGRATRARGRRQPQRGRLRRPVHREHDGDGVPGARASRRSGRATCPRWTPRRRRWRSTPGSW